MSLRSVQRRRAGFTLIEILAAFMILALGVGSVLTMLTGSVLRERTAVMRSRIVDALPFVEQQVRERLLAPGELEPVVSEQVPGFPDLKWSARFAVMPDWPGEVLARIGITWRESGDTREEPFLFLFSRLESFESRAPKALLEKPAR